MSNVLTANPLVVDTAGATALTTYAFTVSKIRWFGATTAAHTAVVHDAGGTVRYSASATVAGYTDNCDFNPPLLMSGLTVPTLASGTLHIYVASSVPIKT